MDSDAMKDLFLDVVKRAKRKYDFRIENFCILGNHFHFIIQPGDRCCLSSVMQWILSVFAMTFNRLHHYTGHVWGERFHSVILGCLRDFLRVFYYIDQNPVRAGLVDDPKDWRYGDLHHRRKGLHDVVEEVDWITG